MSRSHKFGLFMKGSLSGQSDVAAEQNNVAYNAMYALPKVALFLLISGPLQVLPGIAVKYFGMSLGALALAKLLSRLFDGITDPFIGYFSDRFQQRFGTRKPIIVFGGVLVLVTSGMLYIPYGWDAQNPEPISFIYFMFFYLGFTLAWTIMEIPHLAWGVAMSSGTKSRSQRLSFRSIATFTAPLLFFAIPFLPFFETTEITPETLKYVVYLSWLLMPLCLWICMRLVPNSYGDQTENTKIEMKEILQPLSKKQRFQQIAKVVISNRPLLIFYLTYTFLGLGYVMSSSLTFFFVDNYLGIAEKLPYAFLVSFGIGVPSALLWGLLVPKLGARNTWFMGMFICTLGLMGIAFISPSESSFLPYLVCKGLIGVGYASCPVAAYTLLAHITDYGKWKYSQECTGLYFSLRTSIYKFNAAIGGAIGLLLAQWLGFDPLAEEMSDTAVMALRFAYIGLPLIFLTLVLFMIPIIPMNNSQYLIVSKRLAAIKQRG